MWAGLQGLQSHGEFMVRICCDEDLGAADVYEGDDSAWDRLEAELAWFPRSPLLRCAPHDSGCCTNSGIDARAAVG